MDQGAVDVCQQFLNVLKVERRLSLNTLKAYERDLSQYSEW